MNKNYYILLILIFISCSSNKNIAENYIEIEDSLIDIQFSPSLLENEIMENLFLKIEPVDAKELNRISYEKTLFGGDYLKEASIMTLLEEKLNNGELSQSKKNGLNQKKQRIMYINQMIDSNQMPREIGEALITKLWDLREGTDGIESKINTEFTSQYNPYKIDSKYLSVFKLEFVNESNEVKTFKRESLVFNSGDEQLMPFGIEYFDKVFDQNQEVLRVAHRINLPEELSIPPGQSITKYVSISAINPNVSSIIASALSENISSNFQYSISRGAEKKSIRLRQIHLEANNEFKLGLKRYYFAILTEDSRVYILKENTIYLPEELMSQKINIYGLASIENGFAVDKILGLRINDSESNIFKFEFSEQIKHKR
tara:strand:+ start:22 stop:1137 length:1116 start_codon:yes stop_codon:yes gene_type:complete